MITDASAKDGGVYICLLEVLVRRVVNINVTDGVTITGECSTFAPLLYWHKSETYPDSIGLIPLGQNEYLLEICDKKWIYSD